MIIQNAKIAIFKKDERLTKLGLHVMEKCDICFEENGNYKYYKIIKSRFPLKVERNL